MTWEQDRERRLADALSGRYEFLSRIGRGGFAAVHKVKNVRLRRIEALKVLSQELSEDSDFGERFEQEARVSASLDHSNIVKVYDYAVTDGIAWFSMQFIDGTTLGKTINSATSKIDEAGVAAIAVPILDALDYSHSRGVIHRDIKPDNIILDSRERPFLTDFGIAKAEDSQLKTRTGALLGSPAYMAPEQIRNGRIDGRSDLYALGITLYKMLTRGFPFTANDTIGAAMKKLSELPESLSTKRPDLHPEFEAIIMRALALNPDDRFATAFEMRRAFESFFDVFGLRDRATGERTPRSPAFPWERTPTSVPPPPRPTPLPMSPTPPVPYEPSLAKTRVEVFSEPEVLQEASWDKTREHQIPEMTGNISSTSLNARGDFESTRPNEVDQPEEMTTTSPPPARYESSRAVVDPGDSRVWKTLGVLVLGLIVITGWIVWWTGPRDSSDGRPKDAILGATTARVTPMAAAQPTISDQVGTADSFVPDSHTNSAGSAPAETTTPEAVSSSSSSTSSPVALVSPSVVISPRIQPASEPRGESVATRAAGNNSRNARIPPAVAEPGIASRQHERVGGSASARLRYCASYEPTTYSQGAISENPAGFSADQGAAFRGPRTDAARIQIEISVQPATFQNGDVFEVSGRLSNGGDSDLVVSRIDESTPRESEGYRSVPSISLPLTVSSGGLLPIYRSQGALNGGSTYRKQLRVTDSFRDSWRASVIIRPCSSQ